MAYHYLSRILISALPFSYTRTQSSPAKKKSNLSSLILTMYNHVKMCSSWVKKRKWQKNNTRAKYGKVLHVHSFGWKNIHFRFHFPHFQSSNQTGRSIFWIYEFACEQQNDLGTKLFWSCLLNGKRCLKWMHICIIERGQYTAILTEQARLIKDLSNDQNIAPFLGGEKAGNWAGKVDITDSELGQQRIYYMVKEKTFSCGTNQVFESKIMKW